MKIDCTQTINFMREHKRMCNSLCACSNCKIAERFVSSGKYIESDTCEKYIEDNPEEVIALVQEWSDKHPLTDTVKEVKDGWEYKIAYLSCRGHEEQMNDGTGYWQLDLANALNELGSEGWELLYMSPKLIDNAVDGYGVFKRKILIK